MSHPSLTILLVEDDEAFRYAADRYLTAKGYSVISASGSMEALQVIDGGGGIDVAIVDIGLLPNEPHGVALGRMIRAKFSRMQILFVTGIVDIETHETELPGPIIFKPVELPDLHLKVQELLGR